MRPEPEPPRKMIPSRRIQSRIDSIESSIERMKHAEHCGASSKPTLNQTGELNDATWLTRIAFSSAWKVSASSSRGEVPALDAPAGDRVGDARDHLLDAALALGRGHAAAEVLLRDDVRRGLRPELRELDVALLERGTALAGDQRVARLPLDLVERVAARNREVAPRRDARLLVEDAVHVLLLLRCLRRLLGGGHPVLPGRDVELLPAPGAKRASCERIGDARTRVGRHKKAALCRKIARASTSGSTGREARRSAAARDAQPTAPVTSSVPASAASTITG